tara:strand:- start:117 stop:1043 length:927 start_codon:yes stop_codon:yes gene_type:complete
MKQLYASHNYAQKHYHGLHFGISVFGKDWRLRHRMIGGRMHRLKDQDINNIFKDETVLIFGNIYGHRDPEQQKKFNHPSALRQKNIDFYYWDNPHIPHLLYHNPANPMGHKNWCRMVFNHTHRQCDAVRRPNQSIQRINEQLHHLSAHTLKTWRDLVPVWRDCKRRSMTALLCPSGDKTFTHHYNITRSEWTNSWRTILERLGYRVFVRPKPGRELRQAPHRLCDQLVRNNVGITVSNHSIVAVESMLAGVPAVVSGSNATGELGTPAEEFEQTGILRPVDMDQLIDWCEQLLLDDYHKSEVYNGTWH